MASLDGAASVRLWRVGLEYRSNEIGADSRYGIEIEVTGRSPGLARRLVVLCQPSTGQLEFREVVCHLVDPIDARDPGSDTAQW
jgi:hypothetical protein